MVPAHHLLRDLGSSLLNIDIPSARDRILQYLLRYPLEPIKGEELMIVGGISEWARRVRELRVQYGWKIISGLSVLEMAGEEGVQDDSFDIGRMSPDEYMLLSRESDREAAFRWNVANDIRKKQNLGTRDKILSYLRQNVGSEVTGDELRYVANNKSEWARRVRELRTEYGWPIVTRHTGMPILPVGTYLLELDRQAPVHDRRIPDLLRGEVLHRDEFRCQKCSWHIDEYNRADPRILELHHGKRHVDGGENSAKNLITLCNLCHDRVHAGEQT